MSELQHDPKYSGSDGNEDVEGASWQQHCGAPLGDVDGGGNIL